MRAPLGTEAMKDEELIENAMVIYNTLLASLPQEKNNLKSIMIKLTMGKPTIIKAREAEAKQ